MLDAAANLFPRFARLAADRELEQVLPPASSHEVGTLEQRLGLPLPESYKGLLRCARGFWLMGGVVQFGSGHPFVHDFPPLDTLTPQQRRTVALKGGPWPPARACCVLLSSSWRRTETKCCSIRAAGWSAASTRSCTGRTKADHPLSVNSPPASSSSWRGFWNIRRSSNPKTPNQALQQTGHANDG